MSEIALYGRGMSASFNGRSLRLIRRGTIWAIPVEAVRSVEQISAQEVRIELSGDADHARHGLGSRISILHGDANTAEVFTQRVRQAMCTTKTSPYGHALVEVVILGSQVNKWIRIGAAVLLYVAVLVVLGWGESSATGICLAVAGLVGPLGAGILYYAGTRYIRDVIVLRRSGVTVLGSCMDRDRSGGDTSYHPLLRFQTVDGQEFSGGRPRVSVSNGSLIEGSLVNVTYDPIYPRTAMAPLSLNHILGTGLVVAAGMVVVLIWTAVLIWAVM